MICANVGGTHKMITVHNKGHVMLTNVIDLFINAYYDVPELIDLN